MLPPARHRAPCFPPADTGTQVAQQNGTVACRVVDVVRKAIRTYSAADGYRCGCLPRQQGKPAGNPNVAWAPRDKACPAGYVPSYFGRCRAVNAVGKVERAGWGRFGLRVHTA